MGEDVVPSVSPFEAPKVGEEGGRGHEETDSPVNIDIDVSGGEGARVSNAADAGGVSFHNGEVVGCQRSEEVLRIG